MYIHTHAHACKRVFERHRTIKSNFKAEGGTEARDYYQFFVFVLACGTFSLRSQSWRIKNVRQIIDVEGRFSWRSEYSRRWLSPGWCFARGIADRLFLTLQNASVAQAPSLLSRKKKKHTHLHYEEMINTNIIRKQEENVFQWL